MTNDIDRLDACIAKLNTVKAILAKKNSVLDVHACGELNETIKILTDISKNTSRRSQNVAAA